MSSEEALREAFKNNQLSSAAHGHLLAWLTEPKYAPYRAELNQLVTEQKWVELNDSFFQVLPFGTGGRRGTVGIGPNRINRVTIGESAQGLADYLTSLDGATKKQGVVIAHDTRLTSKEFTAVTAAVFSANGFAVYVFDDFRPTPELSFAVRHLKAAAGVVISASHNPPQDNGFKVYWSDGGQLVSPHAENLTKYVSEVKEIRQLRVAAPGAPHAARSDSEHDVGVNGADRTRSQEIDDAYVSAVLAESLVETRSAKIVYSPLHGTGIKSVLPALEKAGFSVTVVEEQATPDGNFPTVAKNSPNPENIPANDQAASLAQKMEADIAITTDPDADRLGVLARTRLPGEARPTGMADTGDYQFLTGNQIAALLGWFVAAELKHQNKLQPNHFFVKTIVTTDFLNAIAADYDIPIYDDLLIGFKYVAEMIRTKQDNGGELFLFGGEESHGILKGSYTRDKDAAIAALLMAELTSHLKDQGHTLLWQLNELYKKYGIFIETLTSTYYGGATGFATMQKIMTALRTRPPTVIGEYPVVSVIDRALDVHGTVGDVLIFHLSDDQRTRITVRPSGTEPKLKLYVQLHQPVEPNIPDENLPAAKKKAHESAQQLTAAVVAYCNQLA